METIDVLIVGAGPSGLTMALECARYNLSFRIIDKASQASPYSKAIAIQARTLETFQRMGVHKAFLEEGVRITGAMFHSKGKKLSEVHLSHLKTPFPFALSLEQSRTESILTDSLAERGFSIERDTELLEFEEQNDFILTKTNKRTISSRYLIGCDGPHSPVRKALGCRFEGKTFKDVFSLADVLIDWDLPHDKIAAFLEAKGMIAAIPLPEKNRYRLIFQLKRLRNLFKGTNHTQGVLDPSKFPPPTLQEIQDFFSKCTKKPFTLSDPKWIANFHINSRLSNLYRKNNVFLIGDAAHIHSPVGGQGMNTGIQDAFNLAWKIAYVHLHKKDPKLLDTYQEERHSLGKELLSGTEKASRLVSLHSPFLIGLRNFFLSHFLSIGWLQKKLTLAISELNVGYPLPRVPNYTMIQDGKEYEYFSFVEKSTRYHLLYHGATKPKNVPLHTDLFEVKEKLSSPTLVRPDGYPTTLKEENNLLHIEEPFHKKF